MANITGTWTLFMRETRRFMKVYMQTILAPVINNLLYLAIFGLSFRSVAFNIQGVEYLQFLVPGLIIMGIINNAFQNPSSSMIIMKYQGLISDIMSIPLKRIEIMIAFISSAVLRALIVGAVTLITSLFFVSFTYPSITVIITSALLVSLFFSFLGLFVGIVADEFDRMAFLQNFILMPLIFLGGVFYPISNLPPFFLHLSSFNPIVHMINLLRYGFTGLAEIPLLTSYLVLGIGTLLIAIVTYVLLLRGWKLQN